MCSYINCIQEIRKGEWIILTQISSNTIIGTYLGFKNYSLSIITRILQYSEFSINYPYLPFNSVYDARGFSIEYIPHTSSYLCLVNQQKISVNLTFKRYIKIIIFLKVKLQTYKYYYYKC